MVDPVTVEKNTPEFAIELVAVIPGLAILRFTVRLSTITADPVAVEKYIFSAIIADVLIVEPVMVE